MSLEEIGALDDELIVRDEHILQLVSAIGIRETQYLPLQKLDARIAVVGPASWFGRLPGAVERKAQDTPSE